jgi:hypothetical protein
MDIMQQSGIVLPKWPKAPCNNKGCYACTYRLKRRFESARTENLIGKRGSWTTATSSNPVDGWKVAKLLCSGDRTWAFLTHDEEKGPPRTAFVHFDDVVLDCERFPAIPETVRSTL